LLLVWQSDGMDDDWQALLLVWQSDGIDDDLDHVRTAVGSRLRAWEEAG
jgi:hypothetical protein